MKGHVQRFGLPEGYITRFVEMDDFGYCNKRDVFENLISEFKLLINISDLLVDYDNYAFSKPTIMCNSYIVLEDLRYQGIKIGIVTNGWKEAQERVINGLNLEYWVDDVIISKEVGLSKPDPRIYQLALERLSVEAVSSWFVGDSPQNDIWGPQQVGMRAAFLPTGHVLGSEQPDAVLSDLRDVLQLI